MSVNIFIRVSLALRSNLLRVTTRCYATNNTAETKSNELDLANVVDEPAFDEDAEEMAEIEKKRNKSRLNPHHRNILFGKKPYNEAQDWYHSTVRYKKRMLGRYGLSALDVTPGVLWPTQAEVADVKEYERVAYPRTIQEEMEIIKANEQRKKEVIEKREAELAIKAAKNEQWIKDLHEKIEEKQRLMDQAKERRIKIIDEIRREQQLSFVDIRDPKIQALLEEKEKKFQKQIRSEKKKLKEERKEKRALKTASKSVIEKKDTKDMSDSEESERNTAKNEETDKQ